MKRTISMLAIGLMGTWAAAAQTSASGQAGASMQSQPSVQGTNAAAQASANGSASAATSAADNTANIVGGTKIDASLATSLDAKRSKVGDEVEVRTEEDIKQDGRVVMKKGTRLVGHVTQAQPRANGQAQSQLGIVFDRAVLKNGQEMPFSAWIQALASAQSAAASSVAADDAMASSGGMSPTRVTSRNGGGLVGGVASTANATAGAAAGTVVNTASSAPVNAGGSLNTVARSSGAVGGLTSNGRLASNSSGVFGLEGLSIDSAASSAAKGSMIVSATKNVHLDSGTQLLLQTTEQAR